MSYEDSQINLRRIEFRITRLKKRRDNIEREIRKDERRIHLIKSELFTNKGVK